MMVLSQAASQTETKNKSNRKSRNILLFFLSERRFNLNKSIIQRYKEADSNGRIKILLAAFLFTAVLILGVIYCVGNTIRNLPGSDSSKGAFYYAIATKHGRRLSLIFTILVVLLIIVIVFRTSKKNWVTKDDYRGVHYMDQKTHGSAEWMDRARAEEAFTVCNIKDTNEVIYGQFSDNGEEVVGYKKPKLAELNRNIFVLAPSGSGKSYTQVNTQFIQHIKAGHSVAMTDPGGNGYCKLSKFAAKRAKVEVINFGDPAYSLTWNMVKECINPDTERLDGTRLNMFVNTFVANTGEGLQDYYFKVAANLIKAVIGYTSYWNEKAVLAGYERLYLKVSGKMKDEGDKYFTRVNNSLASFKWCRDYIMKTAIENGYREEDIKKCFDSIRRYANQARPFTIGEVYNNIINFAKVEDYMSKGEAPIEIWHPAMTNYTVYSAAKPEARHAAIQGAQLRFELFIDPNIRYILSNDGLDLMKFNTEQTALFVITQDKSDETDPIASLLFTFLFKDVQDVYDKNNQIAQGEGVPNPCLGSAFILDDFFSLGILGGRPELFAKTMADARKRQVYITIVVQQIRQIRGLYGEDFKDSIQGNCATLIYLGGNDPDTIEFISKFAGKATVLDESHGVRSNILSLATTDPGYRSTTTQRDLLTPDEARTWKDRILVIFQGEDPLELRPFTWVELPEYKNGECETTSVYKELKPIYDRESIDGPSAGKIEQDLKKIMDKSISSLKNYDVDKETGEIMPRIKKKTAQDTEHKTDKRNDFDEHTVPLEVQDLFGNQERADIKKLNLSFSELRKENNNV